MGNFMRARTSKWLPAALAAFAATSSAAGAVEAPSTVLLKPAAVFTADDAVTHPGWVVLVTGDKITAVGPAASVYEHGETPGPL